MMSTEGEKNSFIVEIVIPPLACRYADVTRALRGRYAGVTRTMLPPLSVEGRAVRNVGVRHAAISACQGCGAQGAHCPPRQGTILGMPRTADARRAHLNDHVWPRRYLPLHTALLAVTHLNDDVWPRRLDIRRHLLELGSRVIIEHDHVRARRARLARILLGGALDLHLKRTCNGRVTDV